MRKHLFKPLLVFALVLVCGNAWGATYKLEKVSSVSAGNLYVFEQNGHVMNNEITNNALQTTTEYKTKGLDGTETYVWKLVSVGEDLFYLLNVSIELFLNNESSTTVSFGGKLSKWSIAFTNGIALVSNTSNSDRFLGYTSSNSYAYKAYATSNLSSYSHAITMYQLVADDDNLPDVPVNPTITAKDMSCGVGESFDVSQMFSSNSDGAITYSVEGANADDYELDGSEFLSEVAGTYTIKASQAAVDGKYNAGEATAILTVIGMYTLHIIQPELGGTLTVKDGETPLTDGCKVTVGTKLTCEVTDIPEGKRFSRFYVNYDNDGEKYKQTNPATFDNLPTEGITEATVTVRYQDLAKYTATFVSNNEEWIKADLWENEGLVFPDDPEIEGYAFMGWTTSSTVNADGIGITYAKEGDFIQSNTTFYAVFAVQEGSGEGSEKLTGSEITNLEKLEYATAKYFTDGTVDYMFYAYKQNEANLWLQIKKDEGSYVKISVPYTITKVELTITGASNSSGGVNDISKHTDFSGTVALTKEDCTFYTTSSNIASVSSGDLVNKVATLIPSENVSEVYVKVSAGARIWGINVTYSNVSYSDYTTFCSKAYAVTITSSGYSTLYLDYAAEVPEGVTAFYATEYDAVNDQVVLTEVSDNVIAANQGVILKGTAGTEYSFVETASVTAPTANLLRGTVASEGILGLSGENGDYILKSGAFAPISGGTLAAHKAYLHVEGRKTHNESNSIGIRFDGATMIENMTVVEDNIYFDLQGRKVENPINGLYIVNGKKVMVK